MGRGVSRNLFREGSIFCFKGGEAKLEITLETIDSIDSKGGGV